MMLTLNDRAYQNARTAIEAGAVSRATFDPTLEQLDELAADPGRYYLGVEQAVDADNPTRWHYPVGLLSGGELVVYCEALQQAADNASQADEAVAGGALKLLGLIDAGADADAGDEAADATDDADAAGAAPEPPPPPKPPEQVNPGLAGGGRQLEGARLARAIADGDRAARALALSRLRDAGGRWKRTLTGDDLVRAMGTNRFPMRDSEGRPDLALSVERVLQVDREARTVALSFSSEYPGARWWGIEILGHAPGEVRLGRLNAGGALLLVHNDFDQVGAAIRAWLDDEARKGRAEVRLSQSGRGMEILTDVEDGIRTNVSVGYLVHRMVLVEDNGEDELPVYRVTDWEPLEISLVPVPFDPTVGTGRTIDHDGAVRAESREIAMPDPKRESPAATAATPPAAPAVAAPVPATPAPPPVDVREIQNKAAAAERERSTTIRQLGKLNDLADFAEQHVQDGTALADFRTLILDKIGERGGKPVKPRSASDDEIGLTEPEIGRFSFLRALRALATTNKVADFGSKAVADAAFEFECSRAVAAKMGQEPQGILVPFEVLRRPSIDLEAVRRLGGAVSQRDLEVATDTAGGYLVGTKLVGFIELLSHKMLTRRMGITVLGGLVGDVAIPRQSGGATHYWISTEGGAPTESTPTLAQLSLTPHEGGAFTDLTRKFIKQSSQDAEMFVRNDISRSLALASDAAVIKGTGISGQPLGILNTTGIGIQGPDTNGSAVDWADVTGLFGEIAQDDADVGELGFLTTPKNAAAMMSAPKESGQASYIMEGFGPDGFGRILGLRCGVSGQVPSDLEQGSGSALSALICGYWPDAVLAQWGTLDITVDPYTHSTSGALRVVGLQDVDVGLRHVESFAAKKDCIAT